MDEVLSKGTLFPEELVSDLYNKVKGKSSIAALHAQEPISFNGNEIMTFSMDAEVDLVAENGKRSALAKQTDKAGAKLYPQLAWGSNPGTINGCQVEVNSTVSFGASKDKAILGDFQRAFKWGYAKQVTLEVIPYGDPDNSGKDLQGYGQVYLRAQTYIGFGILDKTAFSIIKSAT